MTTNVTQLIERALLVAVAILGSVFLGRLAAEHSFLDIGLLVFVLVVLVAWFLPRLHMTFLILSSSIPMILAVSGRAESGAGVNMNAFDPFLGATVLVVCVKFALLAVRGGDRLPVSVLSMIVFFLWVGVELLLSVKRYPNIAALGECRTYYGSLVLVPYLIAQMTTSDQRARMFRLLLRLCLINIVWILAATIFLYKGVGGFHNTAALITMHLLYGVGVIVLYKDVRIFPLPRWCMLVVATAGFGLMIAPVHRSVALAVLMFFGVAVLLRRVSVSRLTMLCGLALGIVSVAAVLSIKSGHDPVRFVKEQSRAFYSPVDDQNAYWRLVLWQEASKRIRANPVKGVGMGTHFQLKGSHDVVVTTSPHNAYITIAYHLGLLGLALYAVFVILTVVAFVKRSGAHALNPSDRHIVHLGVLVVMSVHAFYLAYSIEENFVSWAFIGLACSVLVHANEDEEGGESDAG